MDVRFLWSEVGVEFMIVVFDDLDFVVCFVVRGSVDYNVVYFVVVNGVVD